MLNNRTIGVEFISLKDREDAGQKFILRAKDHMERDKCRKNQSKRGQNQDLI